MDKKPYGSGYLNNNGYRMIPGGNGTSVLEHRAIMSAHIGRPLHSDEQVHHRNGVRDDNRLTNLELRVAPHGAKITVDDAVAWAHEILARYA